MSNKVPNCYKENRRDTRVFFPNPTLTEQHHIEYTAIKNIMARYEHSGVIDHVNKHQGTYGDYINAPDFQEAQIAIAQAKEMFLSVPAQIRADFQNDPGAFIDFMQNPENREKIQAYGLTTSHLPPITDVDSPKSSVTENKAHPQAPTPPEPQSPPATAQAAS